MLLTIRTTHRPATDLGYLLHKNPARLHSFDLAFGRAHVFYPEASDDACTAALMIEVDPVAIVRGRGADGAGPLDQYVNDRPYVASSFLSVALGRVFATALGGRCPQRPELAATRLPLETRIASLPCSAGESLLRRLFEPLGYRVAVEGTALDPKFPEWGNSPYFTVTLRADCRLSDLLTHLYVLIPVLDGKKHYWVGEDEVEKLLRRGEGWLERHPAREVIATRYLRHRRNLVQQAIARLTEDEPDTDEEPIAWPGEAQEAQIELPVRLGDQRMAAVVGALQNLGAVRVLDLGCGEGKLLKALLADQQFREIVGMDVSHRSLEIGARRLQLDRLAPMQRERVRLLHGSLVYGDRRLAGFDAACVIEVIEHLDAARLRALERTLFGVARPKAVVLTTPNVEYNVKWPTLPAGGLRHPDHRFEWTRAEFAQWTKATASAYGYRVRIEPIGPEDPVVGAPTQMGVFER